MLEYTAFIDIGNTCVKINHGNEFKIIGICQGWLDIFTDFINENNINEAIVASSNSVCKEEIINWFDKNNVKSTQANKLLEKQTIIDFSNIIGMGIDRKLGLLGATHFLDGSIIVVDCGSAITTNILGNDNKCYGGTIMLGMGTHARALNHYTTELPIVNLRNISTENNFLDNTYDAIMQGIISTARGGIIDCLSSEISRINKVFDNPLGNIDIIFTGGFGSRLFELCEEKIIRNSLIRNSLSTVQYKSNLVLLGLKRIYMED